MVISMTPMDEGSKLEEYIFNELRNGAANVRAKDAETIVYQFKDSKALVTIKYVANGNPLARHSAYILGTDTERLQIENNVNEYFSKKN